MGPPPLFFDQNEARRTGKRFYGDRPPPLSQGLADRAPHLSEGLDPPLSSHISKKVSYIAGGSATNEIHAHFTQAVSKQRIVIYL